MLYRFKIRPCERNRAVSGKLAGYFATRPPPDFGTAVGWERFVAGSPNTVREHLTRYAEKSTCNYFVGSFQWGDLSHEEASRSMGLFMSEVMPSVAEF